MTAIVSKKWYSNSKWSSNYSFSSSNFAAHFPQTTAVLHGKDGLSTG